MQHYVMHLRVFLVISLLEVAHAKVFMVDYEDENCTMPRLAYSMEIIRSPSPFQNCYNGNYNGNGSINLQTALCSDGKVFVVGEGCANSSCIGCESLGRQYLYEPSEYDKHLAGECHIRKYPVYDEKRVDFSWKIEYSKLSGGSLPGVNPCSQSDREAQEKISLSSPVLWTASFGDNRSLNCEFLGPDSQGYQFTYPFTILNTGSVCHHSDTSSYNSLSWCSGGKVKEIVLECPTASCQGDCRPWRKFDKYRDSLSEWSVVEYSSADFDLHLMGECHLQTIRERKIIYSRGFNVTFIDPLVYKEPVDKSSHLSNPCSLTHYSMTSCRDIRKAYKQTCCGKDPKSTFAFTPVRRLAAWHSHKEQVVDDLVGALRKVNVSGGPKKLARLIQQINEVVEQYD